jgi:SAM-dependent methyltransferase
MGEDAYREDLAYIHDAGFGRYTRGAARLLLDDLRRRGVERGLVVDLGCGGGLLAEQLSAGGFDVLGIDISAAQIALARQRVPRGRFRVESALLAELPPCVAVAAVGECFNYLFDSGHSVLGVRRVLGRAFAALAPGGPLLFDVAGPGCVPGPSPSRNHFEADDWAILVTTEEDAGQRLLTRHITSFRKVGELYRRDHEVHRLRLLPAAEVASWLHEAGFRAQNLDGYGEVKLAPGRVGFLAHKPEEAR